MHDNVTAISYCQQYGGHTCFCTKNQLCVSAAHTPGTINIEADNQSRVLEDATEWKLNPTLFHKIVEKFGKPDIISVLLELISN